MSEKKDYLSMLAEEAEAKKKPASYNEEKFERVEKPRMNLDPKVLIGGVIGLVVIGLVAYFLFFSPKIKMPNFIGQTKSDVSAWIKQEGLETSGIIMKEEYNFENKEGVIIDQSVAEGKKIKKDAKITFTASLGADPDELVAFPEDVPSMTRSEVQAWIDTNKLTGVKITQSYSENVAEGTVISFDLKGIDKTDFRRSTSVSFVVSRGVQPAGTITVEDFYKKDVASVETFASSKKIVLEKVEVYSDEIASGLVVSQSVASGKTMNQGGTLTISVSKGKAVSIPNFTTYTSDMLAVWEADKDNNVQLIKKEIYSNATKGSVVSQSIKAGSKVDQGSVVELTISLGRPVLQNTSKEWIGKDYLELVRWVDDKWTKGARIEVGNWLENTGADANNPTTGAITQIMCLDKDGKELSNKCDGIIPIDGKIAYGMVTGEYTASTPSPSLTSITKSGFTDYAMFKAACSANGITIIEVVDSSLSATDFVLYKSNGTTSIADSDKIYSGDTIIVKLQSAS